ncbi:filamentous hemagglutinin N-terminal domain-containing protein [Selenomonas caprae]|uniref:Filamentous hemagglutinin N-terminal domain-containing protein n=1 Tax=Selenomonas caprae TaxID=2606905 RepID=A0A5D6WRH4_9FIRM|nr:MBG domain-containing protein [Selenomonas caprae]TYZ30450.1 filamentous hemagglutinin N-terminal domain-containing protein [Selenomonas caprae]
MRITRKRRRAAERRLKQKHLLTQGLRRGAGVVAAGAMMISGSQHGWALPQGGQVAAGAAEIAQKNVEMAIRQQSQNAIINWQSFNIGANERVNIFQPNSQAALLNRVMDGNVTQIMGALQANGRVFIVNPAGILFAPGAQVNVGSLVASTLQISNADFMAGQYAFVSQKDGGKVINKGELIAKNQGLVALLGQQAENDGVIVAKKGTAALAAGEAISLDFDGDGKVAVVPSKNAVEHVVTNKGLVEADGGLVFMSAAAGEALTDSVVNQEGIVRAQSLDGKGGTVAVTASVVNAKAGSVIDVSGDNGGKVEVGGGWQGSGELAHAKQVIVEKGAQIKADATAEDGNGGEAAIWSDGKTAFHGDISAKGKGTGAGGRVETSGHELSVTGHVEAASEQGQNGQWLLDPYNVTITDGGTGDAVDGNSYTAAKSDSKIANTVVNAALQANTDVKISTGTAAGGDNGDITINGSIQSSGKNATLSLEAARDIIINKDITGEQLNLDFKSNSGNGGTFMGGKIKQAADSTITTNGGSVYFHGGNTDDMARATVTGESGIQLAGTITTAGGNITLHGATNEKNADGVQITGKVDAGAGKLAILAHNEAGGNGLAYDGTMSAKDMQLTMDAAKGSGTITSTTDADGNKGTLTIQTEKKNGAISLGSGAGLNITDAVLGGGFAATQIGAADNAGMIQVGSAVSTTGDLTLYGGSITVGAALTSDKNISLKASDKITGTAAGKVTAEVLDVETPGDVRLSTDVALLTGKANSFDITNTSTSQTKHMTLGAEDMKLTAAKDISIKSSGILTSVAGAIHSDAGDITLKADSFDLADDSIQGKGKLTIDTLTPGKSFGVGVDTGDVKLAGVGFAAEGFSGIQFGSKDTGAIRIGTLNVKDAVSFTSGSSITVAGQLSSNGKDMAFTAEGADGFQLENGSVLEAGAADIAIQADKLTLAGAFSAQNTGTLSFSRRSTDAYTIGGNDASSYITDESLQKIGDTFKNIIIGTESGGAVTLADITKPPAYLTVKSGSTATVTGTVKANSLVLAAKEGIQENGGSIKAESLLLQGGKADLTGAGNEIQNLAADVSGALAVNSSADMTIGQVEDRNAEKVVKKEGITTKGGSVKITMDADKKLTMGTIDAGSANITISADSIAKGTSTGKVTTSGKVQLYTTTAEKTIAIDTEEHAGAMNITSDSFAKGAFSNSYGELIIGRRTDEQDGSSQKGKVIIKHTNFSSKTTVRTENQVEFADSNIVGGDLTVHATGLQLDKDSTTDIKNHNLNLNLTDSLDLGEGVINGSGKLNITTPEGKNIYLGGTDFAMPAAEDNGYKIGYGTVNSNLTGFSDFGITTKENVYLYAGGIDKSVKIAGAKGIHVVEDVTLGSADPAAATELTLNSAAGTIDVAAGKTLTINGANTVVHAAAKEIKLAAGAKIEAKAEMAGAAAGKGSVTLTADALELGKGAKIDGGAGSFTLQTDKLTVDRADSVTNIEGKGKLTLATKSAAAKMFVENELTTAENGLHVTAADINGGVFGAGFTELSLGNEKGTGTLTIDSVAFKNSLTLQNGSSGAIVFQGKNSVAAGQAVTLKAGSIRNAAGGSFEAQSGPAGASQLNIYTNDLSKLTGTAGNTIRGTGTLGLSTYDGTTAIHITKDAQAGGLNLYDALLNGTGAFADTFSAFAIGNDTQQSITVSGGTLAKPTTLTTSAEGKITGSGLQAAHVAFVGGDVKLTGDNIIGTVAANVRSLSLEETAGKQLTAGEVNGVKGIAATSGDIELTTDQFDIAGDAKLLGKGKLTIAQKTEGVALNIGDNAIKDHGAGALNIKSEWFVGHDKNPAIADGFSHIYLGGGYGDANIDSSTDLHFLDPTTVRSGFEEAVTKSKTTTISGKTHIHLAGTDGIEFMAQKFKMNGTSTIETESGDISITADEVELASNSSTGTIMTGTQGTVKGGQLNIKTLDENRSIKVGTFNGQIAVDALYLDSSYFDASSTTRIFAKGFDAINIGRGAGKGSYEQSGSITFEDTVNVIQGYKNSNAAVKISGKMSFGEKDYNIRSQNVVLSGADIETTTGNVNITTNSLTNDTSQGRNSIKTTQGGKLTLDTFDKEQEIHIGKTGTPGLDIDKEWFDTDTTTETSIFHGFNEINFGGEDHTGNISVNGFEVPKADGTKPSVVNITNQGDVTQQENGGGLVADKVTIAAGGNVDLTNSENHIQEIGDVTGKKIDIKNNTSTSSKTTGTTTITGHIQGETITVQTDGSIKIDSSGSLESTSGGVTIDAGKGHFINENTNPGSQVIKTPDSQRWIIHTDSPEGDNPGTLVPDGIRYNTQDDKEVKNPTGKDYGWDKNVIAYTKPLVVNVTSERVYGDGNANFITGDAFKAENADKEHKGTATEQAKYAKLLEDLRNNPDKSYKWDDKLTPATAVNTAGGPAAGAIYGNAKEGGIAGKNRQIEYVGDNNLNATVNIDFKITPRTVTVTAANDTKTYDGKAYTSNENGNGQVTYENIYTEDKNAEGGFKKGIITGGSIRYGTAQSGKTSAEGAKDAGSYAIGIQDSDLTSNGNYVFVYQDGTLTIDKRKLAVSAGDVQKVYGTDDPSSVAGTVTGGSLADGQQSRLDIQTAGQKYQNVGETTAVTVNKVTILDENGEDVTKNYDITQSDGVLKVTPRDVIVTAADYERVYGQGNDQLEPVGRAGYTVGAAIDTADEHTGLVNGDTLTAVTISKDVTGIDALTDAGTYAGTIKAAGGTITPGKAQNYHIIYKDGNLVIHKKQVVVKAVDDSRKYDGTSYTGGNGVTYEGFLPDQDITNIAGKSGAISYGKTADTGQENAQGAVHAGSYAIGIQGSDLTAKNYEFAYEDGNLTITPRQVKVKVENGSRVFGQPNDVVKVTGHAVDEAGYDGLLVGDSFADFSITSAADDKANVGDYSMQVKEASLSKDSKSWSTDYHVTADPGRLTITPREVCITAGSASRSYGEENPVVKAYTVERGDSRTTRGLLFGDALADVTLYYDAGITPATEQGSYAGVIHANKDWKFQGTSVDNYRFVYAPGDLTITLGGLRPGSPEHIGVETSTTVITPRLTEPVDTEVDSPQGTRQPVPAVSPGNVATGEHIPSIDTAAPAIDVPVNTKGTMAQPDTVVIKTGGDKPAASSFQSNPDGSFGLTLQADAGPLEGEEIRVAGYMEHGGQSETPGAIPVLYTDGAAKKLDGIYIINYASDKLTIMPSAQKVTIPEPTEIRRESTSKYDFMYQSREGSYDVSYGNGIVAIYPQDEDSRKVLTDDSKKAGRTVLSAGILSAVQNLGVMPDQIRAVYMFTKIV